MPELFQQVSNHGFGKEIHIKPIRKEPKQYITVKHIPQVDSEEVRLLKEKYRQNKTMK